MANTNLGHLGGRAKKFLPSWAPEWPPKWKNYKKTLKKRKLLGSLTRRGQLGGPFEWGSLGARLTGQINQGVRSGQIRSGIRSIWVVSALNRGVIRVSGRSVYQVIRPLSGLSDQSGLQSDPNWSSLSPRNLLYSMFPIKMSPHTLLVCIPL